MVKSTVIRGSRLTDELNAPLGNLARPRPKLKLPPWTLHATAGGLALILLMFGFWMAVVDDPLGGEPMAAAGIERRPGDGTRPSGEPAGPAAGQAKQQAAAGSQPAGRTDGSEPQTVTIIDGTSGRRQEVVVQGRTAAQAGAPDAKLIEQSRHGSIPRIGQDGVRPSDAYARPKPAAPANQPQIAIVIVGLGTSATRTSDALSKLPGVITLGFSPYGKNIDQWIGRARANGHELILQVPMEPFDYPDNDPGPQTLLTSLVADQNVDRLHWFMSRFQGYVGITNMMGGRFTASEQSFAPILREVAKRGLLYLDDGASPRSLAGQIAGANNAAFARSDVVLDASPTSSEIDNALGRLESIARERGRAVGIASTLPVSIERIAQWVKLVEERGVTLVPLTAVANKPKSS